MKTVSKNFCNERKFFPRNFPNSHGADKEFETHVERTVRLTVLAHAHNYRRLTRMNVTKAFQYQQCREYSEAQNTPLRRESDRNALE